MKDKQYHRLQKLDGKKILWPLFTKYDISRLQTKNLILYTYMHGLWKLNRNRNPSISLKIKNLIYGGYYIFDPNTSFMISKICIRFGVDWEETKKKIFNEQIYWTEDKVIVNFLLFSSCRIIYNGVKHYDASKKDIQIFADELLALGHDKNIYFLLLTKSNYFFNPDNVVTPIQVATDIFLVANQALRIKEKA